VLGGEDFGWRHDRGLVALADGEHGGRESDDRLPRAYLSLEEAVEPRAPFDIGANLRKNAFLRRGELKGKRSEKPLLELVGRRNRRALLSPREPGAALLEKEMQEEDLFDLEAPARRIEPLRIIG